MLPMYMLATVPQNISGVLDEDQGVPGLQPVDHQCPEEQRHNHVGRDAERKERDEPAAGCRVICRFGAGHALDGAFSEPLRVFGEFFSIA